MGILQERLNVGSGLVGRSKRGGVIYHIRYWNRRIVLIYAHQREGS